MEKKEKTRYVSPSIEQYDMEIESCMQVPVSGNGTIKDYGEVDSGDTSIDGGGYGEGTDF